MFVATRVDEIFSFAGCRLQLEHPFVVTSPDAQTWAAPQASHYWRGDKFEKPMGTIARARAQVKLSGYPGGNSRQTCTQECN